MNVKRGTSWKQKIRLEIDRLIATSKNIDEVFCELELKGYTVRRGKYISVKAPEQQRAARLNTLGVDYTPESYCFKNSVERCGSECYLEWRTVTNLC